MPRWNNIIFLLLSLHRGPTSRAYSPDSWIGLRWRHQCLNKKFPKSQRHYCASSIFHHNDHLFSSIRFNSLNQRESGCVYIQRDRQIERERERESAVNWVLVTIAQATQPGEAERRRHSLVSIWWGLISALVARLIQRHFSLFLKLLQRFYFVRFSYLFFPFVIIYKKGSELTKLIARGAPD